MAPCSPAWSPCAWAWWPTPPRRPPAGGSMAPRCVKKWPRGEKNEVGESQKIWRRMVYLRMVYFMENPTLKIWMISFRASPIWGMLGRSMLIRFGWKSCSCYGDWGDCQRDEIRDVNPTSAWMFFLRQTLQYHCTIYIYIYIHILYLCMFVSYQVFPIKTI